jgi:hypothetical protein
MKAFQSVVLSVIAVGVLLIAYGVFVFRPQPSAQVVYDPQTGAYQLASPMYAGERLSLPMPNAAGYAAPSAYGYQTMAPAGARAVPVMYTQQPAVQQLPERPRTTRAVRPAGRDWTKTALVIGGSTATGAGVGALFGGKTGALIGAAIGGGASTLWEAKH